MLSRLKSIPFEFHVADEKSTNAMIDELVEALEKEERPRKKRSFTEDELAAFFQMVILQLLRKAIEEHGLTTIKELLEEIEEPDDYGESWKDE